MVSSGTPSTSSSEPAAAPAGPAPSGGEGAPAGATQTPAPRRSRARAPRTATATATATRKAASPSAGRSRGAPAAPKALETLAIDIGGTGIKASVLNPTGAMAHDRVRVATPYPLSPLKLVNEIEKLIKELPPFDRVSAGFPGMVRGGRILSAPHFVSASGPGGTPDPKLERAWGRFDLESALSQLTGRPAKVANDADLQGSAVVKGEGFEFVITLGTGVGTAFFMDGRLLPHFEFAHHPFRKKDSYNEAIGDAARKRIGVKKWRNRVTESIEAFRALTFFDHCYIGGGNSMRLGSDLPPDVSIVDNSAGILGGIKLWEVTA